MKLRRLLNYLPSPYISEPLPLSAFSILYAGVDLQWEVTDSQLILTPYGPNVVIRLYNLSDFTIKTLTDEIASIQGYSIVGLSSSLSKYSAKILLKEVGVLSKGQNKVHTTQSILPILMGSFGEELTVSENNINLIANELNILTADNFWLDIWGSYFGIIRNYNELDSAYSLRIIKEILRPRVNAYAIENTIKDITGYPAIIYEPWKDVFKLSGSALSGRSKIFDGKYYSYAVIDAKSEADTDLVNPIVKKNKAAGVIHYITKNITQIPEVGDNVDIPYILLYIDYIFGVGKGYNFKLSNNLILSGGRQNIALLLERLLLYGLASAPSFEYAVDPVYDQYGNEYSSRVTGSAFNFGVYTPVAEFTANASVLPLRAGHYWKIGQLDTLGYRVVSNQIYVDLVPPPEPSVACIITNDQDTEAKGNLTAITIGTLAGRATVTATANGGISTITINPILGIANVQGAATAVGQLNTIAIAPIIGVARVSVTAKGAISTISVSSPTGNATGSAVVNASLSPAITVNAVTGTASLTGDTLFGDVLADSEMYYLTVK